MADVGVPPADTTTVATSSIAGSGIFSITGVTAGRIGLSLGSDVVAVSGFGTLNHSCDPNLGWSGARDLVALRDIAMDEELTVDYSTAIDDDSFVLYCHCGTTRCRQAVEGRDWQIPQLQARYAGHWSPRLQRRLDNLST